MININIRVEENIKNNEIENLRNLDIKDSDEFMCWFAELALSITYSLVDELKLSEIAI